MITMTLGTTTTDMDNSKWKRCVAAATDESLKPLADRRGYTMEFCRWLKANEMIGIFENCIAFPVKGKDGNIVGVHYRTQEKWHYTEGTKVTPLVIGNLSKAKIAYVFESQWDAFAFLDRMERFKNEFLKTNAVFITRGSTQFKLIKKGLAENPAAMVLAYPQNDDPGSQWLAGIRRFSPCLVGVVETPDTHKDFNDWCRAGATKSECILAEVRAIDALVNEPPRTEDDLGDQELENKPFPIDSLPAVLANLIRAVTQEANVPMDLVACMVLGVVSSCVMKGLMGRFIQNKETYANLFILIFARSGIGKTDGLRPCGKPIRDFENEMQEEWERTTYYQSKAELDLLEREKKKLVAKIKLDMPAEDRKSISQKIADIERKLAECRKKLERPRMLVEDVTPEKLAVLMQANDEMASIISDEAGDVLNNILGKYNKLDRPDETLYVKSYSVTATRVDRVSRDSVKLDKPCLSFVMMTQPDKVAMLTSSNQLMEGGFLARCLMHRSPAGPKHIKEEAIDKKAQGEYERVLRRLIQEFRSSKTTKEIQVSAEAKGAMVEYFNKTVDQRNKNLGDMDAFVARYAEQACRIAVMLHAVSYEQPTERPLSLETAQRAIEITEWFVNEQLKVLRGMRAERRKLLRKAVIDAIKNSSKPLSSRDLYRDGICANSEEAAAVINELLNKGYLTETPLATGGRPSTVYTIATKKN